LVLVALSSKGNVIICKENKKNDFLLNRKLDKKFFRINELNLAFQSGLLGDSLALISKARQHAAVINSELGVQLGVTPTAMFVSDLQYESTMFTGRIKSSSITIFSL